MLFYDGIYIYNFFKCNFAKSMDSKEFEKENMPNLGFEVMIMDREGKCNRYYLEYPN